MTQFGLRPPELFPLFNMLGNYYRWFNITKEKVSIQDLDKNIQIELTGTSWIDCLQRRVRVRKKALPEIMQWFDSRCNELYMVHSDHEDSIIELFTRIFAIYYSDDKGRGIMDDLDDAEYLDFLNHVEKKLILNDDEEDHLPVPVFSYIIPTMNTLFILHILLSMGRFETEIDLTMHQSFR